MLILKYFKHKNEATSKTELFNLLDPSGSLSLEMPSILITAANDAVEEVLKAETKQQYVKLTPAQRFEMGS